MTARTPAGAGSPPRQTHGAATGAARDGLAGGDGLTNESVAALRRVPLFARLAAEDLVHLAGLLSRRRYRRGDLIFGQRDPGEDLFLIESGHAKIALTAPDGREFILALLGPGDFFGELALLDGEPRSADAIAQEACVLLRLRRADFLRFLEARPQVGIDLLSVLSRRLRYDTRLVVDAAFSDIATRLARVLITLARQHGRPDTDGLTIASRLTQSDLAGMVGATRESINRWLGVYERQGLIGRRAGLLVIRDLPGLQAAASDVPDAPERW